MAGASARLFVAAAAWLLRAAGARRLVAAHAAAPGPVLIYNTSDLITALGCECAEECGTKSLVHCTASQVCVVKSRDCSRGRANWTPLVGFWDYCEYPAYAPYESLSAGAKHEILMERIRKDDDPSGVFPNVLGIFGESIRVSFEAVSDILPDPNRKKFIHSVGVAAPLTWTSEPGHPYGGLFASGSAHGILRFSVAIEPGKSGFVPGVGIKLLRDGRPSANFVAMPSLDPQQCAEENFFARNFGNHVPLPKGFAQRLLARKFWQASNCPLMVGLSDLADGGPDFPFELSLRAVPGVSVDCPCTDYAQCVRNLADLPAGPLFDVFAAAAPGGELQRIGGIALDASPVASKFGDEQLFLRHQHMEDDFKLHPEWLRSIDFPTDCGMRSVGTEPPRADTGCTAPFNLFSSMRQDDVSLP